MSSKNVDMKHLWEVEHDYYCNDGNYFSNDCGMEFNTWSDFLSEFGDSDFDMRDAPLCPHRATIKPPKTFYDRDL